MTPVCSNCEYSALGRTTIRLHIYRNHPHAIHAQLNARLESETDSLNNTVTHPDGNAVEQDAGSNTKSCLEENFNATQVNFLVSLDYQVYYCKTLLKKIIMIITNHYLILHLR